MEQFEIQDDKTVIFRGSLFEVVRICNILSRLKKKGENLTETELNLIPFKKWYGNLKIVSVIQEIEFESCFHEATNFLH